MKDNVIKGLDYFTAHVVMLSLLIFVVSLITLISAIFIQFTKIALDTTAISLLISLIIGFIFVFIRAVYDDEFKLHKSHRSW
jgi:uncharacterized membrane-anchored protein